MRRAQVIAGRAFKIASSTNAYLIGVPLTLAVAAGGIFLGSRLSHNPRFASDNSPLLQALVDAGLFLLTAFFMGVQRLGLLAALGVAAVLVLAILLICGRLVGTLLITAIRGSRSDKPKGHSTDDPHDHTLTSEEPEGGEVEVTVEDMQAFLSR
jgi:hypothetical protein